MLLAGVFYYLPNVNDFIVEVLVGSLNSQVKQRSSCILKGINLGFYFLLNLLILSCFWLCSICF